MTLPSNPTYEGLNAFLRAAAKARPPGPADRLRNFFHEWRRLSIPVTTAPLERRDLSLERLRSGLTALAPLQDAAKRTAADLNIWAVAGIGSDELRTSSVLAWLLNPTGSHGASDTFARVLWSAVDGQRLGFDVSGLRRSATEVCPLADAADRVDVVLEGDDFVLFIEVKIHAGLQPRQLERYAAAAERSARLRGKKHYAVIYLAPNPTVLPARCLWLPWRALARALSAAAPSIPAPFVAGAVDQFAKHVGRHG